MQDYRNKEMNRAVALGCVGFMLMVGLGIGSVLIAGAVALLR